MKFNLCAGCFMESTRQQDKLYERNLHILRIRYKGTQNVILMDVKAFWMNLTKIMDPVSKNKKWDLTWRFLETLHFFFFFNSLRVFFHDHSRITGVQGKGEDISLTPHYRFRSLHRHLDISRAITAESSPLHIRTGNLWFPSASR